MVADALRHMTMGSVCHVEEAKKDLVKDVHRLARLGVRFEDAPYGDFMSIITLICLWWLI